MNEKEFINEVFKNAKDLSLEYTYDHENVVCDGANVTRHQITFVKGCAGQFAFFFDENDGSNEFSYSSIYEFDKPLTKEDISGYKSLFKKNKGIYDELIFEDEDDKILHLFGSRSFNDLTVDKVKKLVSGIYEKLPITDKLFKDCEAACRIESLDFTIRTYNALRSNGFKTVEQLLACPKDKLKKLRYIGPSVYNEIVSNLKSKGMELL